MRLPNGQIEVNFRGLDTDVFYELDGDTVDFWFAEPTLNTERLTLLEEQRIIDACLSDGGYE